MDNRLIQHAQKVISTVASKSNRAILFYSGGKDSIALLDLMAPHFKEILCVFMYFVKDLDHINKFLNFAANRYPNVKVVQVPHWTLSHVYAGGVFCEPNPNIKLLGLSDIDEAIRERTGIEWSFFGFKAADNQNRAFMMKEYGEGATSKAQKVYPLSQWKDADVLEYIRFKNLPPPVRYTKKKSQGMGFEAEVFLWLQKNYPQDLAKIYKQFPLSQKILIDYANRQKSTKA